MNTWNRHIHTGTQNVHNVHNAHIDNIGIPKHKKTLTTSEFMYETFYYLWVKRFFDIRKREAHSFYDDFAICTPTTTCSTCHKASASSESQPTSSDAKTPLTDFSHISAHASGAWRHSHPWSHSSLGFLFWHLWMTHPNHVRVNTCAHVAPN